MTTKFADGRACVLLWLCVCVARLTAAAAAARVRESVVTAAAVIEAGGSLCKVGSAHSFLLEHHTSTKSFNQNAKRLGPAT